MCHPRQSAALAACRVGTESELQVFRLGVQRQAERRTSDCDQQTVSALSRLKALSKSAWALVIGIGLARFALAGNF